MTAGRPAKFNTPEELEEMVNGYFDSLVYKDNEGIEHYSPATISGLALFLGFCSKQSLYDYEKREEFSYPVKRARLMIEADYERRLDGKSVTGAIFALKNMGWEDKVGVDNNISGELTTNQTVDLSKLDKETLLKLKNVT